MSNPYYNFTVPLTPFNKARSGDLNAEFAAIAAGFDALPAPGQSSFEDNPTVKVALTFDGGEADTVLRSDAQLALDQDIAPTWTGQHTFAAALGSDDEAQFASGAPGYVFVESDAAANNRRWRHYAINEQLVWDVQNDAESAAVAWLAVDRTANTVDSVALASTAITWNGTHLATRGENTFTAGQTVSVNGDAFLSLVDTGALTNERVWRLRSTGGTFALSAYTNGLGGNTNPLLIERTGTNIDSIDFTSDELNWNGDAVATAVSGSFTGTLSGMGSATTGTIHYRIVGGVATLWADGNILGTSNSSAMALSGLPAEVRPSATRTTTCPTADNGESLLSRADISAVGIVTFGLYDSTVSPGKLYGGLANYTTSGSKGLNSHWTITYPL